MSSVMIGCQVKDAANWLPRYIHSIEHLEGDIKRVCCIYGASQDLTYPLLKHWQATSRFKIEVYQEPWLPPEERAGFMLARLKKEFQKLLLEDYWFLCDPDVVEVPKDTLTRLVEDGKDVVAPYVWIEGRDPKVFFDTYGFRKDGCRWNPFDPPRADGMEPVEVEAVGSCYLATAKALKEGTFSNPFPHIQFCKSIRDKGMSVWADPRVNIQHVDLEKYGITHRPPMIKLSESPYLDSHGRKVSATVLQAIQYETWMRDYDRWVASNRFDEYMWLRGWNSKRPLLTASLKVLNEGEYLAYVLENIYPYVDRIDIVEGAVDKARHASTLDGYSTDNTVKIIEEFPDPDRKVRLLRGHWRSKEHVQEKLLEICVGRWMFFIDGDELYLDQDLEQIRGFCASHLDGSIVCAQAERTLNFWHDFKHYLYSKNEASPWGRISSAHPILVWRDTPGLNFRLFHTYPCDGLGRNIILDDEYVERRVVLRNLVLYHYGHVKTPVNIANKLQYLKNRAMGEVQGEVKDDPWFTGKLPDDMVLAEYNGVHPKALDSHPYRFIEGERVAPS